MVVSRNIQYGFSTMRAHGRVSIGEIIKLTGVSRNTLKEHFRKLVEQGYLSEQGGGRSTWYVPSWWV